MPDIFSRLVGKPRVVTGIAAVASPGLCWLLEPESPGPRPPPPLSAAVDESQVPPSPAAAVPPTP